MSKQKESKHISIWISESLLKECDINQIRIFWLLIKQFGINYENADTLHKVALRR